MQDTPPDLHFTQYAVRLLEEITFPLDRHNIRCVALALESEVKRGKSKAAAYEYVLACVKDLQDEGEPIDTFTFTQVKYRPENRRRLNAGDKAVEYFDNEIKLARDGDGRIRRAKAQ